MENKGGKTTVLGLTKPYRLRILLAPMLKAVECLTELAVPFVVRAIIDEGLTEGGSHYQDLGFILGLASLVFVFAIVGFSVTMVTQYLASAVSTVYCRDLRAKLFDHLSLSSAKQLDDFGKSKSLNLLTTDSTAIQNGLQQFMRLMVRAPFLVLGSVVCAFVLSLYAGLAVLASLVLCSLVIFFVLRRTPRMNVGLQAQLDKITTLGDDAVVGGRVVRAFNKQDEEIASFGAQTEKYRRMAIAIRRVESFINPLTFGFVNLAMVGVVALGSFAYPKTGLSVGSIVALISFLTQSLAALLQFTKLVTSLSRAIACAKRVDGFFALGIDIADGPKGEGEEDPKAPLLEFRDVSLSFGGENCAVSHVDLLLREGESIGIIGGTGSGKSTILSLMMRFYDATEGEVLFRGSPIREWKLSCVRSPFALVSQKPQIFRGSFRDNVALGKEYSEEEMQQAIEDSLCAEYLCHWADGVEHPIEEDGANLSGGQKQRLLLCRALLSGRNVLLLDDATSALDYKSDLKVRQAIARRQGMTTVLVSQRATSLHNCDRIYVLDHGSVVGVGNHEELLSSCPIYREIYEAQVSQK